MAGRTSRRAPLVVLLAAAAGLAGAATDAAPRPGQAERSAAAGPALLERYCVACHNDRLRTAGLTLQGLEMGAVDRDPELWEKVLGKLRAGDMPPAGRPRPAANEVGPFVARLTAGLDRFAREHPDPGRPALHRLNRTEYGNAVRDLLDLEVDVAALLPADDSGGGFDNIADVLTVSPLLLERYLSAARKVSRLAVGDPAQRAVLYRVPRTLVQDRRTDAALPLGTRGGVAIRHYFPMDGEYLLKVRMQRNRIDEIRGLLHAYRIDVLIDGRRVESFAVGGEEMERGAEGLEATYTALANYLTHADDEFELRVAVTAGPHVVGVTFPSPSSAIEGPPEKPVQPKSWDYYHAKLGLAGIGAVEIRGPYHVAGPGETPSRRRIFTCRPAPGDTAARGTPLRTGDRRGAGAPGVPAAGHRGRPADAARFLRVGTRRRRVRGRRRARPAADSRQPLLPVSDRAGSGRDRAGHAVPARRHRAGVAAVLLPLEQRPRRAAAGAGNRGTAGRSVGAGARGAADAGRPARERPGRQLRRAMARHAQPGVRRAQRGSVPGVRREPAARVSTRDRAVHPERPARGPQRLRPAHREPHVRERAPRSSLRPAGRARRLVPAGRAGAGPGGARGHPGARQRADGHVAGNPHVAGEPRQVDSREPAGHAAASAAARRAGPGRG